MWMMWETSVRGRMKRELISDEINKIKKKWSEHIPFPSHRYDNYISVFYIFVFYLLCGPYSCFINPCLRYSCFTYPCFINPCFLNIILSTIVFDSIHFRRAVLFLSYFIVFLLFIKIEGPSIDRITNCLKMKEW